VATAYGYDLVILKKDVIVYRNAATITDITDLVKSEIQTYL
jgi:Skp family chaperone for outer membrane proteins